MAMDPEHDIRAVTLAAARGIVPVEQARTAVLGRTGAEPVSVTLRLDPAVVDAAKNPAALPTPEREAQEKLFRELFDQPDLDKLIQEDETLGRLLIEQEIVPLDAVEECLETQRKFAATGVRPIPRLGVMLARKNLLQPTSWTLAPGAGRARALSETQVRAMPPEVAQAMKDPKSRVGRYVLVKLLGQGGMGMVFKAWEPALRQWVAVKFLTRIGDDTARAYFKCEAQLAAALEHPSVPKIHEIGERDGTPYIAMQFVDGAPLSGKDKKMDEKIGLVRHVAEAVRFAHEKGVIHRDLKPANVMVDKNGLVFVMDFGLAKETSVEGASLGGSSIIVGTPGYMAPEQAKGKAEAQSDVYGIGAILYELVTGRAPFVGETAADVLDQVIHRDVVWPRKISPTTPEDVQAILLHALEKDPLRRYANATEMIEDLEAYETRNPLRHARRPNLAYKLGKKIRKQPLLWAVGALAILGILGGTIFGFLNLLRAHRESEQRVREVTAERDRTEKQRERADAERAYAESEERKAKERLSYSHLLRAWQASEIGDDGIAAIYYAEAYAAHESGLTRANAAAASAESVSLRAFLSHQGIVQCVAFSPDGKRIATGSQDKTARLWDAETGEPIGKAMPHEGSILDLAFSPDGKVLVTGSQDQTARLWDAATGEPIGPPMRHEGKVNAVAFSPAGEWVATGGEGKTVRLWNKRDPIGKVLQHGDWVLAVAYSRDGKWFITGCQDKAARLWDAETGQPVGEPMRHEGYVNAVAFSPDGKKVVTASSDASARLWEAGTGKLIWDAMRHEDKVVSVAFSPDGKRVVTGSLDHTARLWDVGTRKAMGKAMRHDAPINAVAFSPDGKWVLTASADYTVRLWSARSGDPIGKSMRHDQRVIAAAFSPDGKRVVTASAENSARLWDVGTGGPAGKPMQHKSLSNMLNFVAYSPDGRRIATASADFTARLWDGTTGASLGKALQHKNWVNGVAFSPDGKRLATGDSDNAARIWDAETREPIGDPLSHEAWVFGVAFSPDGKRLATGCQDGTVRVCDIGTGKEIWKERRHKDWVYTVAFSPDGKRIVSGGRDATARLWNAETGEPLGAAMGHDGSVTSVAFSPDGRRVVTANWPKSARLWDAETGEPVGRAMRHENSTSAVAFSPDGEWIVTGSRDRVRLWDSKTWDPVGHAMRLEGVVTSVAFSPDGKRIVSGIKDRGTALLWNVSSLADATAPDLLRLRIQVRTGLRLDSAGEVEVLSPDAWRTLKKRLEQSETK